MTKETIIKTLSKNKRICFFGTIFLLSLLIFSLSPKASAALPQGWSTAEVHSSSNNYPMFTSIVTSQEGTVHIISTAYESGVHKLKHSIKHPSSSTWTVQNILGQSCLSGSYGKAVLDPVSGNIYFFLNQPGLGIDFYRYHNNISSGLWEWEYKGKVPDTDTTIKPESGQIDAWVDRNQGNNVRVIWCGSSIGVYFGLFSLPIDDWYGGTETVTTEANCYSPTIAVRNNGDIHTLWFKPVGNYNSYGIIYKYYSGGIWHDPSLITYTPTYTSIDYSNMDCAIDAFGNVRGVWNADTYSDGKLLYTCYISPSGTVTYQQLTANIYLRTPQITCTSDNKFHIVYIDSSVSGSYFLSYISSEAITSPIKICNSYVGTTPSITSDPQNNLHVSYSFYNSSTTTFKTYYASYDNAPPTKPGKPSVGSVAVNTLNPKWSWTASTDTGSGIKEYNVYASNSNYGTPIDSKTTTEAFASLNLQSQGTKYCWVQAKDNSGNLSASSECGTVVVDSTTPECTVFYINDNDELISTGEATLHIEAHDNLSKITSFAVTNDPNYTNWGWNSGAGPGSGEIKLSDIGKTPDINITINSYAWKIDRGNSGDGVKTVYVKLWDEAGNYMTGPAYASSDAITLDTHAPTGTILINNGTASTREANVNLHITANDAFSNVTKFALTNDITKTNCWQTPENGGYGSGIIDINQETVGISPAQTIDFNYPWDITASPNQPLGDGERKVWIKFWDSLGNYMINTSYASFDAITLNTSGPIININRIHVNQNPPPINDSIYGLSSAITSDAVAVEFYSDPNLYVESKLGECPVYSNGSFEAIEIGNNEYGIIYLVARNSLGTRSAVTSVFNDIEPPLKPVISIPASQSVSTNEATYNFYGTAETDSSVTLYRSVDNTSAMGTMEVTDGTFHFVGVELERDKKNTFYVIAKDTVGNPSQGSLSKEINQISSAPTGTIAIADNADYTKDTIVDLTITCSDPNFTEFAITNKIDAINCWQPPYGSSIKTASTLDNGVYHSWDLTAGGQGDGTRSVYIKFKNSVGNSTVSPFPTDTIILDRTAPTITLVSPADGQVFDLTSVDVSGSVTDLVDGVDARSEVKRATIKVDNGSVTDLTLSANSFSRTLTNLSEGPHTIVLQAEDNALNLGNPLTINITINRSASGTVTINNGNLLTNSELVTLAITRSDTNVGECRVSNTSDFSSAAARTFTTDTINVSDWELASPTTDGQKTVYVQFKDLADGDTSTASATIKLDKTPPSISNVKVDGFDTSSLATEKVSTKPLIEANISDTNSVAQVTVSIDGKTAKDVTSSLASGKLSYRTDYLSIGQHTMIITAKDAVGNEYCASTIQFEVIASDDVQLVTAPMCYPNPFNPLNTTPGNEIKISYELNNPATITIYVFDMNARLVWKKIVVHEVAGVQIVGWNGINDYSEVLQNGVYIYRIVDNQSKKALGKGKILVVKGAK